MCVCVCMYAHTHIRVNPEGAFPMLGIPEGQIPDTGNVERGTVPETVNLGGSFPMLGRPLQ